MLYDYIIEAAEKIDNTNQTAEAQFLSTFCDCEYPVNKDGLYSLIFHFDFSKSTNLSYTYYGVRFNPVLKHIVRVDLYCDPSYYFKITAKNSPDIKDIEDLEHLIRFYIQVPEDEQFEESWTFKELNASDIFSPIVWFVPIENNMKHYVAVKNLTHANEIDRVSLPNLINSRCLLNYEITKPPVVQGKLPLKTLYSQVNHYITKDKFIYDFSSYPKELLIEKIENLIEAKIKLDAMQYPMSIISLDLHKDTLTEDLELLKYIYTRIDKVMYATQFCFGLNCIDIDKLDSYEDIFTAIEAMKGVIEPLTYNNANLLVNFSNADILNVFLTKCQASNRFAEDKDFDITQYKNTTLDPISINKRISILSGCHTMHDLFEKIYFGSLIVSDVKTTYTFKGEEQIA